MNLGNPNYQTWAKTYYLSQMQSQGYTGIFCDNAGFANTGSGTTPGTPEAPGAGADAGQTYTEYATQESLPVVDSGGSGTFTLTIAGQTTASITYSSTIATLLANINAALNTTFGPSVILASGTSLATLVFWLGPYQGDHVTVTPSTSGVSFNSGTNVSSSSAISGLVAADTYWNNDYASCLAISQNYFGSSYPIYPNLGQYGSNWPGILPYVPGVFREWFINHDSPMTAPVFAGTLAAVAQAQAAGVRNVFQIRNVFDNSAPTAEVCYPGYFWLNNAITDLAQYYLMANPTDYLCMGNNSCDPLTFFNFGALNYNVGAPVSMPSGDTPVVSSTGPAGCYVFATGPEPGSPSDSGTGTWAYNSGSGAWVLTDNSKTWTTNQWAGFSISDAAGNVYEVYANTSHTISCYIGSLPTPASGTYCVAQSIYTVYARQYANALVLYKPYNNNATTPGITVASATIASAGSGYTNGDIVTVQGGTYAYGAQAQFELTVSGGVVTAATLYTSANSGATARAGNYSVFPTGPVSVTGGTGSGLTLNLTQTPGSQSTATTLSLPVSPTGNWYFLNADYNGVVNSTTPLTQITLDDGEAAILVTKPSSGQGPVLANMESTSLSYVQGQAATQVTANLTASDSESATIASATVAITGNYQSNQDVLSFTPTANITGSWSAATGILTLSGSDTLTDYQAALRSVMYVDTSSNPSSVTRTVSFQINDGISESNVVTRQITVTVNGTVALGPPSLPADTVNKAYNQTITASGGTGTITLTISNLQGSITGLSVPTSGTGSLTISGTPTASGTETFTVTATDSLGDTTSTNYSITINAAVALGPSSLPADTVNKAYNQTVTASGGTGTDTLAVTNIQNAIAGLVLPASGSNSLTISGTPTAAGTETFMVTATDTLGATTSTNYSITVNAAVAMGPPTLPADTVNKAYNQTLTAQRRHGHQDPGRHQYPGRYRRPGRACQRQQHAEHYRHAHGGRDGDLHGHGHRHPGGHGLDQLQHHGQCGRGARAFKPAGRHGQQGV